MDVVLETQEEVPKPDPHQVGLFATCLVDFFRPSVGFATVRLLEHAGCRVSVPEAQTCCGQIAYNSGDRGSARNIARQVIEEFSEFDYVVAPSGSCTGMLRDYPGLFTRDDPVYEAAVALSEKAYEITSFLVDVLGYTNPPGRYHGSVTYHDSCSGLRQLRVGEQPRLLVRATGAEIKEMQDSDVCCGFGGAFCVKFDQISDRIVSEKTRCIRGAGARMLLAGDLGCLLNMAGKLKREGDATEVRHVVEILAGLISNPAIGEAQGG